MHHGLQWDIFCQVIDNHGDLGVCWRLAADLAERGQRVRLWVDDPSALAWMAPQGAPGVQLLDWQSAHTLARAHVPATDVLVEAFGCEIPEPFLAVTVEAFKGQQTQPAWINLEYLSAEPYVERNHGLPSPVFSGPAAGWSKRFFYPGFTRYTGGLLREPALRQRQQLFDAVAWRARHGVRDVCRHFTASLFCYEPPALTALLDHWAQHGHHGQPVLLWVTAGRAAAVVRQVMAGAEGHGLLSLQFLPHLTQADFDHLLWTCDLNLVRGEDSLVRALWAGRPLAWQLYPQHDDAHLSKLQAFLQKAQAPGAVRAWHQAWNPSVRQPEGVSSFAYPCPAEWTVWQQQALDFRAQLQAQDDLTSQLLGFVGKSG